MNGGCIVRLVKDPELRYSNDGKPWLAARAGIESRVKVNGEWTTELIWCDLKVFGKVAEHVAGNSRKGTRLVVVGRLEANNWTTKEGEKRDGLALVADHVGLDLTFGLEDDQTSDAYGASGDVF